MLYHAKSNLGLQTAHFSASMNCTYKINLKADETPRAKGFTLVEIMIVVAIIGLLMAIAIPSFIKARATAQASGCINNLRQYDDASQIWALETWQATGAAAPKNKDIKPYIKLTSDKQLPGCPAGGTYKFKKVGVEPGVTCSLGKTVTPAHIMP